MNVQLISIRIPWSRVLVLRAWVAVTAAPARSPFAVKSLTRPEHRDALSLSISIFKWEQKPQRRVAANLTQNTRVRAWLRWRVAIDLDATPFRNARKGPELEVDAQV